MKNQEHKSGEGWYSIEDDLIFDKLKTSNKGLSTKEVKSRRDIYGENKLSGGKKVTLVEIILHQLLNPPPIKNLRLWIY